METVNSMHFRDNGGAIIGIFRLWFCWAALAGWRVEIPLGWASNFRLELRHIRNLITHDWAYAGNFGTKRPFGVTILYNES